MIYANSQQQPSAGDVVPMESRLDRYRQVLAQCAMFRGLPTAALEDVARRVQIRSGASGTLLVAQDEPGDALFIVFQGRVKVALFGDNGREVTLAILKPGEVFGELSLLDGSPRSANVVAQVDSQVLALTRDAFTAHLRAWPQTALNLMGEMARRLRRADEAIVGLALQDVESRLRRTLTRLAREEGDVAVEGGGLLLRRRPTQQELANMVGSSRETVSRTFASLIRRGLLVPRGRTIVLTDRLMRPGDSRTAEA